MLQKLAQVQGQDDVTDDLRAQMRSFTFDRAQAAGIPTLLVTHDIEDARAAGGPVLSPLGETLPL